MDLRTAVVKISEAIGPEGCNEIAKADDLIVFHHGLGRWIRNECGLWREDGTNEIVADLRKLLETGYTVEPITNGDWTLDDEPTSSTCDNRVKHPDQCSTVIMLVLRDWLRGNLRRHDMQPVKRYRSIDVRL